MAKKVKKVVNKKSLTKAEFYKHFSEKFEMKTSEVKEFFDELAELAYVEAKKEKGFTLPGFGKLMCKDKKARMGRNPRTGEAVKIPAKTVLKFRISKQAKDSILN